MMLLGKGGAVLQEEKVGKKSAIFDKKKHLLSSHYIQMKHLNLYI